MCPVSPKFQLFCFWSLFDLVLLVFIVITSSVPLESSTFFSTGAINEEGLTPFSFSFSLFSSLLQVPARPLSHLSPLSCRFTLPFLISSPPHSTSLTFLLIFLVLITKFSLNSFCTFLLCHHLLEDSYNTKTCDLSVSNTHTCTHTGYTCN